MKKHLIAHIPALLLAGMMLFSTAACTAPAASESTASGTPVSAQAENGVTTPTSDFKVADATPEEIANASDAEIVRTDETGNAQADGSTPASTAQIGSELITAEAATKQAGSKVTVYRGTIVDFAVNEAGETVWMLAQDVGADYGAEFLNVAVTTDLPIGSVGQQADIANNTHLEVFYTEMKTPTGGTLPEVKAVGVNVLLAADMTIFNGKVIGVTPDPAKPGYGDIEVDPLFTGEKTIFHYAPETIFEGLTADTIKAGDELHIMTNGVSTRSLPPQSSALSIRPYVLCDACPTVPKN